MALIFGFFGVYFGFFVVDCGVFGTGFGFSGVNFGFFENDLGFSESIFGIDLVFVSGFRMSSMFHNREAAVFFYLGFSEFLCLE